MSDFTYLLTFSAGILVITSIFFFLIYGKLRHRVLTMLSTREEDLIRFNKAFLETLPRALTAENLKEGYEKIINGLKSAFDCDVVILEKNGDAMAIASYNVANQKKVSNLLLKAGVLFDIGSIPLSQGRRKLFDSDYIEFEDPFELLSDVTTSAASRKIKKEMGFFRIAASKVGAEGSHSLLILSRQIDQVNKDRLTAFAALIEALLVLSNIRKELDEFKVKFDGELEAAKRTFRVKEAFHQLIFERMPIPAVLLDERGVIIELNQTSISVFGIDSLGNSLYGILPEIVREKFASWLITVDPSRDTFELEFRGKNFRAHKISGLEHESSAETAIFFVDLTQEDSIQSELESMLRAATSELELVRKAIEEERAFSESIVKNSTVPFIGIRDGIIEIVSGRASEILSIPDSKNIIDFVQANGFSELDFSKEYFETKDGKGRFYEVMCWDSSGYRLAAFHDVTDRFLWREESEEFAENFESLFQHSAPTAIVKGDKFDRWNEEFYDVFKEILSADSSVLSFYHFLGESPEEIGQGVELNGLVRRLCKSIDGRTIDLKVVRGSSAIFIFARDLTDIETLKQNFRGSASRISALLESVYDEPIIIVENGKVVNTNYVAREKLGFKQEVEVEIPAILEPMKVSGEDDLYFISEKFYRLETSKVQNIFIYRLRNVTGEVKSRKLIEAHRRRETLLISLASSESYTYVLSGLRDLATNVFEVYGETSLPKLIGVGLGELDRGFAEVYLYNFQTGKIDPPLSLTLTDNDKLFIMRNGQISRSDVPDTTFGNVLSIFEAEGIFRSSKSDGAIGFAFASFSDLITAEIVSDLNEIFGVASSVALAVFKKANASQQSAHVSKLLQVISGFSTMVSLPSVELMDVSFEFLKSEYGCNGTAYYELEGSIYRLIGDSGGFVKNLNIDSLKFGTYFSSVQSTPLCEGGMGDLFFAVQSQSKKSLLLVQMGKQIPVPFELTTVNQAIVELIESKRLSERESAVDAGLKRRRGDFEDYINRIVAVNSDKDVRLILEEALTKICGESTVEVVAKEVNYQNRGSLYITKENADGRVIYTVDLSAIKGYLLKVATIDNEYASLMINLAAQRIASLAAIELSRLQIDVINLRRDAEFARSEMDRLRATVERVPVAMKHARIEIDKALSGLSSIHPDNEVMRMIKLHLASALKEISLDVVESSYSLDELISVVRKKLSEDGIADKIKRLNLATGADFKMDAVTFDVVKDIFVSSVKALSEQEVDILVESFVLPGEVSMSTGESIEKPRRRLQLAIKTNQDDGVSSLIPNLTTEQFVTAKGTFLDAMVMRLEKLGYDVEVAGDQNQLRISITENIKNAVQQQISKFGYALLVEDDRSLAEEESHVLLEKFEQLRVAHDAIEAEKLLKSELFSFAFVDLSLPSISGRELCLQIKALQPHSFTVLLTNREGEEKSDGVDEIITRPLDKLYLEQVFQRHARG